MTKIALLSAAVTLLAGTTVSFAADRDFCRDYATAAVRQADAAREIPRCLDRDARESTRWSREFRVHFKWCRNMSRDNATAERDARTRRIRECRN